MDAPTPFTPPKFLVVSPSPTARMAAQSEAMRHPNSLSSTDFGRPTLPSRLSRRRLARRAVTLAAGAVLALGALAPASWAQGTRPDQVMWRNPRGQIKTDTGTIIENTLQKTVIETSSGQKVRKSDIVESVRFGDVPTTFTDGVAYFDRGDFPNAAAKFKLAAGDANTPRAVVRAYARLRAAEALMKTAALDPGSFTQAKAEAETFLADHPNNRDVPKVRMLNARATWLGGDAMAAAELYRSLFMEAAGGTPTEGYALVHCYRAGLAAARSFLEASETTQAKELYGTMESSLPGLLSQLDVEDPKRQALLGIQSEARLGDGYILLAEGSATQAKNFFEVRAREADINSPGLIYGARLGLAEAHLAGGNHREAQLEFAFVAALDHTSRDRVARALVGMAECALVLTSVTTSRTDAKTWLEDVRDHYGDTPSVLRALEMLKDF